MTRILSVLPSLGFLILAACSSVQPYPEAWGPLPVGGEDNCGHIVGKYTDRGEIPASPAQPSLTQELFGSNTDWQRVRAVSLSFHHSNLLTIAASGDDGHALERVLSQSNGDFHCKEGRLVITDNRWVFSEALAAKETVTIHLYADSDYLITQVQTNAAGTVAVFIPVSGSSTSWYRFRRLPD